MKKKSYQSPRMKVTTVRMQHMLCGSVTSNQQNEIYEEVPTTTTDGWFN